MRALYILVALGVLWSGGALADQYDGKWRGESQPGKCYTVDVEFTVQGGRITDFKLTGNGRFALIPRELANPSIQGNGLVYVRYGQRGFLIGSITMRGNEFEGDFKVLTDSPDCEMRKVFGTRH